MENLSETVAGAVLERKVLGVDCKIYPSQLAERKCSVWTGGSFLMLQHSKRLRLRGSVAKWGSVQADPLMMSRCST